MRETSQQEHALAQGWRPIAWTRDFDQYRGTIMAGPDGRVVWRVQELFAYCAPGASPRKQFGNSDSLREAEEAITRIVQTNPLIISGLTPSRG